MKTNNNNGAKESDTSQEKFKNFEQKCEYCDTMYTPKRRFVQKYCSKSCRVMAYNNPQYKVSNQRQQETINNKEEELQSAMKKQIEIVKQQEFIRKVILEAGERNYKEIKEELTKKINHLQKGLFSKIKKIENRQMYHMAISLILPFIAEPLRQRLAYNANLSNPPKTYEEFISNIEPYLKTVTPEVREQIINGAKAYYNFG